METEGAAGALVPQRPAESEQPRASRGSSCPQGGGGEREMNSVCNARDSSHQYEKRIPLEDLFVVIIWTVQREHRIAVKEINSKNLSKANIALEDLIL